MNKNIKLTDKEATIEFIRECVRLKLEVNEKLLKNKGNNKKALDDKRKLDKLLNVVGRVNIEII